MGNTKSSHVDFQHSEKIKRTKMEKMRSAFRSTFTANKDHIKDKNKKPIVDVTNNNNGVSLVISSVGIETEYIIYSGSGHIHQPP